MDSLKKNDLECQILDLLQNSLKGLQSMLNNEVQAHELGPILEFLYYIMKRSAILDYLKVSRWCCQVLIAFCQNEVNTAYLRAFNAYMDGLSSLKGSILTAKATNEATLAFMGKFDSHV
jgi:hypothetical protein